MEQNLTDLLMPTGLGRREGLVARARDRLLAALPEGAELVLNGTDVLQATTCGGLWEASQHPGGCPPTAPLLHMRLAHRMAIEFVEASVAGNCQTPGAFVHEMLTSDGRHDALTSAWLLLMDDKARSDLRRHLTWMLERFASSWSTMTSDCRIQFGPADKALALGNLTIVGSHVDITLDGGDDAAVLLAITPGTPCEAMFDSLAVDAVLHGLVTGSPPARLVGWGMAAGHGVAVDVTNRWFETQVSHLTIAARRIVTIRDDHRIQLDPGPHCVSCPIGNVCEISRADEHDPF